MADLIGRESILITGLEGSGKSHYLMSQVKKILDNGFEHNIYIANVKGISLQHPNLKIVEKEFNWLQAEPNSIVIYDEAGTIQRFSNLQNKLHCEELQMISQRRKTGILLVFVAQDAKMINSAMRQLLKFHFHFSNPYNDSKNTHCFVFTGVKSQLSNDNKTWHNQATEEFTHHLDPSIFPLYKSIDDNANHNKKKQVNKKARMLFIIAIGSLILCVILFVIGINLAKSYWHKNLDKEAVKQKIEQHQSHEISPLDQKPQQPQINQIMNNAKDENDMNELNRRTKELYQQRLPPDYQILAYNNDLRVSGVMILNGRCIAYNNYGEKLKVSQSYCQDQLENGMIQNHNMVMNGVTDHSTSQPMATGEAIELPKN